MQQAHDCCSLILKPTMLFDLSPFQSLMENSIHLDREEVIKRYRSLRNVNYYLIQCLYMVQFSFMGKDDEGKFYFC